MLSAQVTHYLLVVAEHYLRHSVIAKLFDNVDAVVALSNNNCRGWGRACGSGCAEGSNEERMLNRAAGKVIREKFVLYFYSLLLFLFYFSHWVAAKKRCCINCPEDTSPQKSRWWMRRLCSLPWSTRLRSALGLLAETAGFGGNSCDAQALLHCEQGETTKLRSHWSPYSCQMLLPFKHYQPGVSFNT